MKTVTIDFLIALLVLRPALLNAGDRVSVSNIRFEVVKKKVLVYYDLHGEPNLRYDVALLLKRDGEKNFSYTPKNVEGDIGEGLSAGVNKQITWDYIKEFPAGLEGNDYFFHVTVEETSSQNYWWVATIAVGAGLLGILLYLSPEHQTSGKPQLPMPPGRP
ncbi:MAG TPA: hypothetical protein VNN76_08730 [Bacteroidota bacterium]|nr:hypothetical protein [Bacteroidota bacterium]